MVVAERRAEGAGGSAARLSDTGLHRDWEASFVDCVFFLLSTYPISFARLETKRKGKLFFCAMVLYCLHSLDVLSVTAS